VVVISLVVSGSVVVGGCDFSVFQLLYYYIDRQLTFQVLLKKYV